MEELNRDITDDCGPDAHQAKRMFDVIPQCMKTLTHFRNKNVLWWSSSVALSDSWHIFIYLVAGSIEW